MAKQVLDDTERLRKRLLKLSIEEARAENRCLGHGMRAQKLKAQREQKKEMHHETTAHRETRQRIIDDQHAAVVDARSEMKRRVDAAKEKALLQKKEVVAQQRYQKQVNECERNIVRAEERERIVERHNTIREGDMSARELVTREQARKVQAIRQQQQREIDRNAYEYEEKMALLKKLEKEEQDKARMVARLKQNEQVRRQHLNDVLSVSRADPDERRHSHEAVEE